MLQYLASIVAVRSALWTPPQGGCEEVSANGGRKLMLMGCGILHVSWEVGAPHLICSKEYSRVWNEDRHILDVESMAGVGTSSP